MKNNFMKFKFVLFILSLFLIASCDEILASNLNESDRPSREVSAINTNLINAILNNDRKLFESALNDGANPNTKLETGGSVLSLSSVNLDFYYFKSLLEKGADPNTFNSRSKKNVIFEVLGPYRREHLKILLKYKPTLEVTDGTDSTPLIYAAILSNYESMQLLLRQGADKTSKNRFGYSALDILNDNASRECKESPCSKLRETMLMLRK
ncbi:ankyrin repeat domain-containing protein [Pseudoalteromonas rubra]|uniref:ankyrin repeat domain-containing protein n=1 Tax=Pseudoalteromonas rubra TaxID=43658 RepID=UPI00026C9E0D|nr:ankyrin repeat domain-containing protein [Pseudoalteromonas rubra]